MTFYSITTENCPFLTIFVIAVVVFLEVHFHYLGKNLLPYDVDFLLCGQ